MSLRGKWIIHSTLPYLVRLCSPQPPLSHRVQRSPNPPCEDVLPRTVNLAYVIKMATATLVCARNITTKALQLRPAVAISKVCDI